MNEQEENSMAENAIAVCLHQSRSMVKELLIGGWTFEKDKSDPNRWCWISPTQGKGLRFFATTQAYQTLYENTEAIPQQEVAIALGEQLRKLCRDNLTLTELGEEFRKAKKLLKLVGMDQ